MKVRVTREDLEKALGGLHLYAWDGRAMVGSAKLFESLRIPTTLEVEAEVVEDDRPHVHVFQCAVCKAPTVSDTHYGTICHNCYEAQP